MKKKDKCEEIRPPNRKTSIYVSDAMREKIGHPELGTGAAITLIITRYREILAAVERCDAKTVNEIAELERKGL